MVEDFSNYWTASIYFQSPENGTVRRVPQMANGRLNGTLLEQEGGITVYYMRPFSGSNKKTTVFKPVSLVFTECSLPQVPPLTQTNVSKNHRASA